jgi:hypothetical protein
MTVEEVLRQTGFTDEQIKALDPKAITAFGGVLTAAEKERQEAATKEAAAKHAQDDAELAQRSNVEFYETKIVPSLTAWEEEKQKIENEKARAAAEAAFYRTQAEEAKKSGFIPNDAPGFDPAKFVAPNPPARDDKGRYVTNVPGATPGSPTFDVTQVYSRAGDAIGVLADIQWEHERLFGQKMPISPSELVRQADAVKLDPKTYAARTFNWDTRRQQMQEEEKKKLREEISAAAVAPYEQRLKDAEEQRKKELAELDRKWSERTGNNPDVRLPQPSKFSDISRAVNAKELPDPLSLNETERRNATRAMIRKDLAESQVA